MQPRDKSGGAIQFASAELQAELGEKAKMCPCGRGPKVNHSKAIDDWPNDFHLGDTIYQCEKCQKSDEDDEAERWADYAEGWADWG